VKDGRPERSHSKSNIPPIHITNNPSCARFACALIPTLFSIRFAHRRAAKMEYRTEEDVKEYINNKEIEEILVEQPTEIRECIKCIDACLSDLLKECERLGILQGNHMAGMQTSSGFVAIKLRQDWHQRHQDNPGRKHMFNVQFDILRRLFDMKVRRDEERSERDPYYP